MRWAVAKYSKHEPTHQHTGQSGAKQEGKIRSREQPQTTDLKRGVSITTDVEVSRCWDMVLASHARRFVHACMHAIYANSQQPK